MFVCPECGGSQSGAADGARCPSDGSVLAPVGDDVLLGTAIGAYRVARLLGIGGMGRVYKGVHPTIGSRVAIKVLSRECSDRRDLVERFFAEAKAVNLIRHESIVNVLDLAMLPDGRPYIIMEYLDGAPLSAIIDHAQRSRMPLPLGGLARLAAEVLDALGAAHAKGIVHRDLKPDNIFVTPSGRPKVLDFGIAKLNDTQMSSATRTGSLLGTPHYMSPEQAAGRPVDLRADLYAMGVILFECATGQKPFVADSLFDLLRKHVDVPPPPPRQYRMDMPPQLEHVILTALEKQPERRFGSAQAMSMALQSSTAMLSAEHWTPITGSGSHRAQPTGGWQPSPPPSWGGASRPARESVPPPIMQPAMQAPPHGGVPGMGHLSTVSASSGQVHVPPAAGKASSNKAVWLGLGAVVLVGGGVAAGVAASGGSGPEPAVAPAQPSVVSGLGSAQIPSLGDIEKMQLQALDEALKNLDSLPPEMKNHVDAYKELAKLPESQRGAKLAELQQKMATQMGQAFDQIPGGPPAEAPDPPPPAGGRPPPPSRTNQPPGFTPSSPPLPKQGPWLETRDLGFPKNYQPERIDVAAMIEWSIAEAKKAVPDAELFRIDVDNVRPDGTANLMLPTLASDHGSLDLRFQSPSRMKPDPSIPKGVKQNWKCEFRIELAHDGAQIRALEGFPCDRNVPVKPPKCSPVQLWKRAIAKRAPADAVANLGYRSAGGHPKWYFDIGTAGNILWSSVFDDGC